MTPRLYMESAKLPDDRELELLTEYVGGFMTDAQVEQFEERLMDDMEFFERMEPFLDAWYAPGGLAAEIEIAKRLGAEHGLRVIPLGPQLRRYRRHVGIAAGAAAAAVLLLMLIQPDNRQPVATQPRVAQHVAPTSDTAPGAHTAATLAKRTPIRRRTSGVTRVASQAQVAPVIPGETVADRALADSTLRALGPVPSAQVTPSGAVAFSAGAPIPITETVDPSPMTSTDRNPAEKAGDMTNPDKTSVKEGTVDRRWWQKMRDWILHIPPKDLVTGGRPG